MKKQWVVMIPEAGPPYVKEIDNSLKALQDCVDGLIERVSIGAEAPLLVKRCTAYANEEGAIRDLPVNYHASSVLDYNMLFGPVVLAKARGMTEPEAYAVLEAIQ